MQTSVDDKTARSQQRAAMLRVFGGTALAFLALLVVALVVRPDLMQMAGGIMMSMMR